MIMLSGLVLVTSVSLGCATLEPGDLGRTDLSTDVVARRADPLSVRCSGVAAPGVLDGCHFLQGRVS